MQLERGAPPSKWIVRLVVGLAVVSWGVALIGDFVSTLLFDSRPGLLLAMNPRLRYLFNAANELDPIPYALIGFGRLVASDPIYYLLGYWYGDRAMAWTARRSRTYGPLVEDGARLFRKAAYPIIFIAPNSIVSALSAASGIRPRVFLGLNLTGTVVRLVAVWYIGGLIEEWIDGIQGFVAEYRLWLFGLSALALLWTVFGEFRGNNSELSQLRALTDDAETDDTVDADDAVDTGAVDTASVDEGERPGVD
ncbi:MAG: hypothetical protein AAGD35_21440 [Actinomycetota bacterium]